MAKLDYEPRKSVPRSGGWVANGLATAFAVLILVALVAGAVWLARHLSALA